MSIKTAAALVLGLLGAAVLAVLPAAAADRHVQIEHEGLTLNGYLTVPEGDGMPERVLLLTHGTLAHGQMAIIRTLQTALADRGVATLAHTLSLDVDGRTGMADCAMTHTHTHADAVAEIAAWAEWLKRQGAAKVPVLGHSRGGNQVARYAATTDDPALTKVVLMAPATWDAASEAAAYEQRHGVPLAPVLQAAQALIGEGKGRETLNPVGFVYCDEATVSADAFAGYYAPDPMMDTPTVLAQVTEPTLLIIAGADAVVTDLPQKLEAAGVDGRAGVTVETVAGADHMFLDFFIEDAADLIAAFLDQPGQ